MASPLTEASTDDRPVYLDCAATTPMDPRVLETVYHYMAVDFGNAGSHSHIYGTRAAKAVENAREAIAAIAGAKADEVYFTSGATESNNIAILGLADAAREASKRHIVTTAIEHKAVLEPIGRLEQQGFEVTYVQPTEGGWVRAQDVIDAVRDDTYLVSVMHVNNETGVIQPLAAIAAGLDDNPAYFHTDASQGFGKELEELVPRIDLISASGHKLYSPKGIGTLIARRRRFKRPPLRPLLIGGGQERGLRSGTLPVPLCAAFGTACTIMYQEWDTWINRCRAIESNLCMALDPYSPTLNGDRENRLPSIINLSFGEIDSDALMLTLKDLVALSTGSACTTAGTEPSHVLRAMHLENTQVRSATRWSWSHLTPDLPIRQIKDRLSALL